MIRRIIRKRRPVPSLTGISLEEELALLRVELMYGLRVNREAYLRRKVDEREQLAARMRDGDAAALLADLRDFLERAVPAQHEPSASVVDIQTRRHSPPAQDPEPA
ncbi:hypothetical protein [Nonomuraea lactucae]|uniref:hypothetical protein n=1 Tax=Nonomuraea lactucae TaxID=2249762 RepID=UPI000DE4FABE|nr:hypothetical protein [Nonomuraea lactucae]